MGFLMLSSKSTAQSTSCTGTLGENIFTNGDFGRGQANILAKDPGIAPGYSYSTSPPPNDGFYTITNDMSKWSNIYSVWHTPKDNSKDQDGYMMVVNASFTPGVFYIQTITGLCENTKYVFSADILNIDRRGLQNRILPNVSFLINGVSKFSSGNIINDEVWKTFDFAFVTDSNQTELILSLVNNAPGGQGNDLALDNISFRPCGPELLISPDNVANICEDGDPIQMDAIIKSQDGASFVLKWQRSIDNGITWDDLPGETTKSVIHNIKIAGTYIYRYMVAGTMQGLSNNKCRIIGPTKVVNVIPKNYVITDTICEGLAYNQAGKSYTTSGTYIDKLTSVFGCDSIVTLNLTFVPDEKISTTPVVKDLSCSYTMDGAITFNNTFGKWPPFLIQVFDGLGNETKALENLSSGPYFYKITDRHGCRLIDSLEIKQPAPFTIDLGKDLTIYLGEKVMLKPESLFEIQSLTWYPSELINCVDDCMNVTFTPFNDLQVSAVASSENGCKVSDSLYIHVIDDAQLYIPNVFKINLNDINGTIGIFGNEAAIQSINGFHIYDRWGNLIFNANNFQLKENITWDGTLENGKRVVSGVYAYTIDVTLINGKNRHLTGTITALE